MRCIPFVKTLQPQVTAFFARCLPEDGRTFEPTGRHQCLTRVDEYYDYFWCLMDGDALVGTVAISKLSESDCELRAVYLLKAYQGQGWGTYMAQHAIDEIKKMKCYKWMYLDTISSKSERAIKMYRRLGFVETEQFKEALYPDLFMKYDLSK